MPADVVITGVGLVTPLGTDPAGVLARIAAGDSAARPPRHFDPAPFSCPLAAEIDDFDPAASVPEPKAVRLMNRDAHLAVAAARLAMRDAGLAPGVPYRRDEVALYGATGLAGLPLAEVAPLIRHSAAPDGRFDPRRFGQTALKRVRPVLSFKILSNMPISFVSIFEEAQGPNAVYNPWEGQGAHALAAAIRAVRRGDAPCALAGGCDAKTHELAFIALEQQGVFRPWRQGGRGPVPGEGAAFLVFEDAVRAGARGATVYARVAGFRCATVPASSDVAAAAAKVMATLASPHPTCVISASDGDAASLAAEAQALAACGISPAEIVRPKPCTGNLFAAAAALQVALAAVVVCRMRGRFGDPPRDGGAAGRTLACAFGHGSEKAAFLLEAP
jgi:3-oxoacyl-[acyl-carrier-protein] synthase II